MDGTIGIKTGSTGEAGYCLVAAVQKKGHTLVSVVLGAQNPTDSRGNVQRKQFTESKRLLNWGFTNFSDATLLDAETYLQELPVRFSSEASHVVVRPTQSVRSWSPGPMTRSGWSSAFASTGMWPPPPLKRGMSWAPSP